MKIRYTDSTGCPVGAFTVEAENEQDRAILAVFLKLPHEDENEWRLHLHSAGSSSKGQESFHFGWIEDYKCQKRRWWQRRKKNA